ncbi:MAG: hypothetical protein HOP17_17520 [Acidobacteria bacterium]|nr:hypothetical protein [Acidobacteriota bacterium]
MQTLAPEDQKKVADFVEQLAHPREITLMEKIEAIRSRVPDEVWEKLPTDGAENLDHYLYGAPKKNGQK